MVKFLRASCDVPINTLRNRTASTRDRDALFRDGDHVPCPPRWPRLLVALVECRGQGAHQIRFCGSRLWPTRSLRREPHPRHISLPCCQRLLERVRRRDFHRTLSKERGVYSSVASVKHVCKSGSRRQQVDRPCFWSCSSRTSPQRLKIHIFTKGLPRTMNHRAGPLTRAPRGKSRHQRCSSVDY